MGQEKGPVKQYCRGAFENGRGGQSRPPLRIFPMSQRGENGGTDCHDQSADWSRNDSVGANGRKGCGE